MIITEVDITKNDELMHYGVLGMRWGVRRNPSSAYARATQKRNELNANVESTRKAYRKAQIKANTGVSAKYNKFQQKASKYQAKANKKATGFFTNEKKAAEYQAKANKYQAKADKRKHKAEKRANNEQAAKADYLKAQKKADKWVKSMDKAFKNTNVSQLSANNIKRGEEHVRSRISA